MINGLILDFMRTLYDPDSDMLMPGAKELLDYCKERAIPLSLVSRGYVDSLQEIKDLGIASYFTKIVLVSKEQNEQKAPHHFAACADAMGLDAKSIGVVGDRTRFELTQANTLGMTTFWYKQGKFASETPTNADEKPDFIITSLMDVLHVM